MPESKSVNYHTKFLIAPAIILPVSGQVSSEISLLPQMQTWWELIIWGHKLIIPAKYLKDTLSWLSHFMFRIFSYPQFGPAGVKTTTKLSNLALKFPPEQKNQKAAMQGAVFVPCLTRASSLFLLGYSLSFWFHWEFSVASRLPYFRCLWNWTAERKMPGLRPFASETWNFLLIYFLSKRGIYLTGSLTDSGNLLFWLKNFSQWIILDKYNRSVWLCWVD